MWIVQAPHRPAPQPYLVPVNPTWSRIAQSRGVRGSASIATARLFKLNETMGPPLACRALVADGRPGGSIMDGSLDAELAFSLASAAAFSHWKNLKDPAILTCF